MACVEYPSASNPTVNWFVPNGVDCQSVVSMRVMSKYRHNYLILKRWVSERLIIGIWVNYSRTIVFGKKVRSNDLSLPCIFHRLIDIEIKYDFYVISYCNKFAFCFHTRISASMSNLKVFRTELNKFGRFRLRKFVICDKKIFGPLVLSLNLYF